MGELKIVKASAGSGKTFSLAYEYVRNVVCEPLRYRNILAVTFTNKATEEMKQRIVKEIFLLSSNAESKFLARLTEELPLDEQTIRERARTALSYILHDYSRFSVLTIDKFFQRIIRSFIKELGIDLNVNLEIQTDSILSNAADALIEQIASDNSLREWIVAFIDEKIEQNRSWEIKKELVSLGNEVFKESYKNESRTVDKAQLSKLVADNVKHCTQVRNRMEECAAKALKLVFDSGLEVEDMAYGKGGFMGYLSVIADGEQKEPSKRATDSINTDTKLYSSKSPHKATIEAISPQIRELLQELLDTYNREINMINSTELVMRNFRNYALLSDLSQKITELYTKGNIMHISDTNHILKRLISGNETPFIFEKVGNRYTHYMIDEFQDTSAVQWDNFVPLIHNALAQSDENPVMLVGDVKQSIYRWRNGDWRILESGAQAEFNAPAPSTLQHNYRSFRRVVEFNNMLIQSCVDLDNQDLNNQLEEALENGSIDRDLFNSLHNITAKAYDGHTQIAGDTQERGYVNITQYDKNEEEEQIPPVISRIEQLLARGYTADEITVLVRTNNQAVQIANMLLDHKNQNPDSPYKYNVITAEALTIGNSATVQFMVAVMKLAVDSKNRIILAQYNRFLKRDLTVAPAIEEIGLLKKLRTMSPVEAFEEVIIFFKLGDTADEIAYIQALAQQVISFTDKRITDLQLFLKWWDENGYRESINISQSRSAITISTVHKSKGLEYKAVIIPFCDWDLKPSNKSVLWCKSSHEPYSQLGSIPITFNKAMGNSCFSKDYFRELIMSHIDNINTLYVAITRACEELHIMIPKAKDPKGKINTLILKTIGNNETFEFGEPVIKAGAGTEVASATGVDSATGVALATEHKASRTDAPITEFPSRKPSAKIKLRQKSQRYFADGEQVALNPRNYGVLMHKLFERARTSEELFAELGSLRKNSVISSDEYENLQTRLTESLENSTISSWFSGDWDTVRSESEIITAEQGEIRRPDRVMIRGGCAVVVDYKFGEQQLPSHRKQVALYSDLLKNMGYTDVKGYIWYVSMNQLIEV